MKKHLGHQHVVSTVVRIGAALAVLAGSAGALASEATEFDIPASVKSRAEVQHELEQAQRENRHLSRGEGSGGDAFDQLREQRSRQSVRAEARMAGRGLAQRELFSGG